jgi:mRNA-degrading endonuclease RelE of RelBE toxin-antitoxin system
MYTIDFSDTAEDDLLYLKKHEQNVIIDVIQKYLTFNPNLVSKRRKKLRPNNIASWELKEGVYRIFYDVDESIKEVMIKAVGWKEHNKLYIRGKERVL